MRALMALLLVVSVTPAATALDTLPSHTRFDETEARFLVRLAHGGALHVGGEGLARVALVFPGDAPRAWHPVPAALQVEVRPPEESWHGLSGTVEVVVQRDDPRAPARVVLRDASGAGTEQDWPVAPERGVPGPGAPLALLALAFPPSLRAWRRGQACSRRGHQG